jgi:hypothetical protein
VDRIDLTAQVIASARRSVETAVEPSPDRFVRAAFDALLSCSRNLALSSDARAAPSRDPTEGAGHDGCRLGLFARIRGMQCWCHRYGSPRRSPVEFTEDLSCH